MIPSALASATIPAPIFSFFFLFHCLVLCFFSPSLNSLSEIYLHLHPSQASIALCSFIRRLFHHVFVR